ncbi:hypothetical protein JCM8097_001065 [Rhodosporidiobolus ruineniae]
METFVDYTGKQRVVQNTEGRSAGAFDEVPLIDIAPFLNPSATPAEKAAVVAQVRHACEDVGFMYLKGHGISPKIEEAAFEQARVFFDQDVAAKQELDYRRSAVFRGYEGLKGNAQGDTKEAFNWANLPGISKIGYEPVADPLNPSDEPAEDDAAAGSGRNVWPSSDSPAAGLRSAVLAHYGACLVLGRRLIQLFALALDLPEDTFDEAFKVPGVLGRVLHYPPQASSSTVSIGVNAHNDIELFTLLLQGPDLACLEVLNRSGEWLLVPPIPGTLVCNIGDMLARWTNDRFVSTTHRVVNKTGERRFSMPVFFGPNYSTVIETFPQFLAPGEKSKYEPITAGEYVWRRLARSRLGRKYDETVKLEDAVKIEVPVSVEAAA